MQWILPSLLLWPSQVFGTVFDVQAALSSCELPDIAPSHCPQLVTYVANASRLDVEREAFASDSNVGAGMLYLALARR
eukprot:3592526-Amphidinium_carterae.1